MKRPVRLILFLLLPLVSFGQKIVTPGSPDINTSRLKSGKSLYTIYYVKGETWTKKGTYTNDLTILGNELKLIVDFKDEKDKWFRKRTSVAETKTLNPVSYKSESLKNSLDLNFGNPITGKYHNLSGGKDKQISIKPAGKFVDFNVSEMLFTTLPLDVGYKAIVPEFYYGDSPDSVLSNYIIKEVKSYIQRSPKTGSHESWLVSVLEESSGAYYTYIIDKKDHRIWQREMPVGGGVTEICVNEELDYQPIESRFNKEENLQKIQNGNSVITGTAFARDHRKGGIAVVNINRAQYAPRGTVVVIMPNSDYIEEWKEVNKKIRKRGKLPEVPIDPNVAACAKKTTVYDDKGHFEFTNLMPGEYLLFTSFGYTHRYSYEYHAGTSYLMHPSGAVLSSNPVYKSASASSGATAEIELKVTIRKDGDKVDVNLKDVR
ncbi:DUF3108 domain-containing protein [Chitinophaga nivalis]|uniref:Carboxypeptidase regulatory-like domain-containing protein n=1 Tax=Chitinophaga nivalis TaxID=2991709 RepID=A0ABT3IUB9_9BACT|nr:hypothetical protein [Chitinophaga nivalis]MCW3463011.1 hypothetical protein [Chitinophaga nivalis]MCW3487299.1 hypothetical protein [Chitinophaga nivalis]